MACKNKCPAKKSLILDILKQSEDIMISQNDPMLKKVQKACIKNLIILKKAKSYAEFKLMSKKTCLLQWEQE